MSIRAVTWLDGNRGKPLRGDSLRPEISTGHPTFFEIDMDLIERLRINQGEIFGPTMNEAADEIERLQAQITAMTKDMDSMKPWRELQRENEELRQKLKSEQESHEAWEQEHIRQCADTERELTALKAQSTEPVAWCKQWVNANGETITYDLSYQQDEESDPADAEKWKPLFTGGSPLSQDGGKQTCAGTASHLIPPTATALVADFKRRCIEVCKDHATDAWDHEGGSLWCAEAIESMPLIGEK